MAKKEIYCVGWEFPGNLGKYVDIYSKHSLADADIVIFELGALQLWGSDSYQGKTCLSDYDSVRARNSVKYWRQELNKAYKEGKTIFIFLSPKKDAFVATGREEISGTGRNQKVSRLVAELDNYDLLPNFKLNFEEGAGNSTFLKKRTNLLEPLWNEIFKEKDYFIEIIPNEDSSYESLLTSKNGKRSLGGIIQGLGNIVFIPPIREDPDHVEFNEKEDKTFWSKKGVQFGARLLKAIINTEKLIRQKAHGTPAPKWASGSKYVFSEEKGILRKIEIFKKDISEIEDKIDFQNNALNKFYQFRLLLFENGKRLEAAILETLRLMGFEAENYDDGVLEIDAVFKSPEGRFIGEAEGRDDKPIAITKISQLIRNLHDDYARDEVEKMAKGVLFGNPFRFKPPEKRKELFTEKVFNTAKTNSIALLFTPDLYPIAIYLSEKKNKEFAKACREAIFAASGEIVKFPPIPKSK